jgi:hypothetical protein
LSRLKEFWLRLEREPEAELVRPTWLDAEIWGRDVLPKLAQKKGCNKVDQRQRIHAHSQ